LKKTAKSFFPYQTKNKNSFKRKKEKPKIQILGTRGKLILDMIIKIFGNEKFNLNLIEKEEKISKVSDLCLASGVYNILKGKYLNISKRGIFGFHESPLPIGRGNAPLNWALIYQFPFLTVSLFRFEKEIDVGNIYGVASCKIEDYDNIISLRKKSFTLMKEILENELERIVSGENKGIKQTSSGTYWEKRKSNSGHIKETTNMTLYDIWMRHVRATDNKNYPFKYKNNVIYWQVSKKAVPNAGFDFPFDKIYKEKLLKGDNVIFPLKSNYYVKFYLLEMRRGK